MLHPSPQKGEEVALAATEGELLSSEPGSWGRGYCSGQGDSGGWLGLLPVVGGDGDQGLEAALKVDLCRKIRVRPGALGILPHPAVPRLCPDQAPGLPITLSFSLPLLLPGNLHCLSSASGPWPPTHPHTLSPFPGPLTTHPSRSQSYVLQSHRSGPRDIDRTPEVRCGPTGHQAA